MRRFGIYPQKVVKWWKTKILLQKHGDKEGKRVKLRTPLQVNAEGTEGRAEPAREYGERTRGLGLEPEHAASQW